MNMGSYRNPILTGFHPDPTICRVGEDYYLATSSFEYFPGVPLFHSRDLAHWRPIGHALTRRSQLDLSRIGSSSGIFAPTLRHFGGKFYLFTTNVGGGGHFYVTADTPESPWSEPVPIEGPGFDPDIFVDHDGTAYFCREDMEKGGIHQWRLDLTTGRLLGEERVIWTGHEDRLCEGPHLYRIGEWYVLLAAEGGTHRGHMVVAGRSRSPKGPFESCPHNPILTQRGRVHHPIQATGHGDLVQDTQGRWWMVFLGIRPVQRYYNASHHLGRETFLAPVFFQDGWPVVNGGHAIELAMKADLPPAHPWPAPPVRDDFAGSELDSCWNFRFNPDPASWSLRERRGWLRLHGLARTLDEPSAQAFVGRRQQHFHCRATALLEFTPGRAGEEAGLCVLMNERHHAEVFLARGAAGVELCVRRRIGDLSAVLAQRPWSAPRVIIEVRANEHDWSLGYIEEAGEFRPLAGASTHYLSSEVAGGFTGTYIGMFATGSGKPASAPADFDWLDYKAEGSDITTPICS